MHRILLIDDDTQLGGPLAAYFARFDMVLECALRPSEGLARLQRGGIDAAILDVMLPEMDGFALCRAIRKDSDIPILMLTARGEVMDRVVGLELGADDYVPKPFEPRELVARVQTVLRRRAPVAARAAPADANLLVFDGLQVHAATRTVQRHGEAVELTSTEFDLLLLLARAPGKVFSRDDILNQLRGHEAELYTRAVDIVVSRLRKKLEPLDCIKTLRNAGYTLALAGSGAMRFKGLKACLRAHRRAKHALAHSLRVRLVALFLLLALAMAGAFMFGMQAALSMGWRDAAKPLVTDYIDKLAAEIGSPPSIERAQALAARLPLSVRISGPQTNWRSHAQDPDYGHGWMDDKRSRPDELRFYERTTADGHRLQFGVSVQAWNDRPRFIGWATLAVLLALTALAYARVRRMLRPLDDIRAGAQRFGAGDFSQSIPITHFHHPDELGELATTINTMGADIHQMLEAKRTLLLAISHELRSPLTRARLNTELLPETPEVQTSREALLRDLALMRDLVTDLLESERLASPHAALHREPVDLAALVCDVVCELQSAHAKADGSGAPHIDTVLPASMPLLPLDPTRMRLLVRNLLDNALRHSSEAAAAPRIEVRALEDGALQLRVRDFGPGVAEDQIPSLGQPFFRPDAARTREGGGVGLGLYLCRLVVQAHGGSFAVRNATPGLEIVVVLSSSKS